MDPRRRVRATRAGRVYPRVLSSARCQSGGPISRCAMRGADGWTAVWPHGERGSRDQRAPTGRHSTVERRHKNGLGCRDRERLSRVGDALGRAPHRHERQTRAEARAYSSSPHGDGCGPGTMPAMSGSSPPPGRGLVVRCALAEARRSSFCFRFSCRARSFARFSRVGLVLFATHPPQPLQSITVQGHMSCAAASDGAFGMCSCAPPFHLVSRPSGLNPRTWREARDRRNAEENGRSFRTTSSSRGG